MFDSTQYLILIGLSPKTFRGESNFGTLGFIQAQKSTSIGQCATGNPAGVGSNHRL